MFLVNSRLGQFSAATSGSGGKPLHPNVALLLPKLRSYFAEFLNRGYLARLRFLTLPTCVGLRYGHQHPSLEAFLVSVESTTSLLNFGRHHISGSMHRGFASDAPYLLKQTPTVCLPILLRHSILHRSIGGIGISTNCPSTTPFGLALGPDLPWEDEPSPGTLRFSAGRILTCLLAYSYQHSHFYTLQRTLQYAFSVYTTLPYPTIKNRCLCFGGKLEPRYIFGAEPLDQ